MDGGHQAIRGRYRRNGNTELDVDAAHAELLASE